MTEEKFEADMEKLKAGDEKEYKKLVEHLSSPMIRFFISNFSLNTAEAEDIWQETLEKSLKQMDTFKDYKYFVYWFFKTARNKIIDNMRRGKTSKQFIAEYKITSNKNYSDHCAYHGCNDENIVITREAIYDLPSKDRDLILMRYQHDLTEKEIAEKLKISVGTVKSKLSRLRRNLEGVLESRIKFR